MILCINLLNDDSYEPVILYCTRTCRVLSFTNLLPEHAEDPDNIDDDEYVN
jgi:hypothetical protein